MLSLSAWAYIETPSHCQTCVVDHKKHVSHLVCMMLREGDDKWKENTARTLSTSSSL